MGLFMRSKLFVEPQRKTVDELKKLGTPIWAVVSNIVSKRNGYLVTAIHEDDWLGTRETYVSDVKPRRPDIGIGGEVRVFIDDFGASGCYYVEC